MKSNQERSNGCLPPKKREILALEQKPLVVAAASPAASVVVANDSPHTENLAWLASVASERCRSRDAEILRCPVPAPYSSSSSSSSLSSSSVVAQPISSVHSSAAMPLASLPAVYPAALPQQAGTIQYAQLAPNVQFISSGPYTGYISSHIIPNSSASAVASQHLDGYTTTYTVSSASKVEQQYHQHHQHHQHQHQQQFQIGLSPADLAAVSLSTSSTQVTSANHQYIHLDGSTPLTVSSPTAHLPLQLHHHHPPTAILPHTLTLAPSQLVVQYADGLAGKKVEGSGKAVLNGEVELVKQCKASGQQQVQSYEARHILLPAEYTTQNPTLVLVAQPNSGPELDPPSGPGKLSLLQTEKGGICLGKPVSRGSSFTSLSSGEALKPSGPHAVIQTSLSPEELPVSLYSSGQPPIIGYITSTGHQHAVSYHATLPQHLVIPSGQSLLIPVSSATSNPTMTHHGGPEVEVSHAVNALTASPATSHISTAMPHAYLATALSKCEVLGSELHPQPVAVTQAQAPPLAPPADPLTRHPSHAAAPVPGSVQPSPSLSSSTASSNSTSSPVALPPFFMRGSIIQLADGELKRVEDLKTEDFIQSAEISSELKIDSSTVERIDSGQTPNAVVIQFAVGELKAQVCVEVLLEYPFFVFGQGWSSCCPDRTTQLFELSCAKLCVGDVCVSLTLRGIRNGSVTTGGQPLEVGLKAGGHQPFYSSHTATEPAVRNSSSPHAAGGNNGLLMKAGSDRLGLHPASGPVLTSGPGDVVYGAVQRRQGPEAPKPDRPPPSDTRQSADADRPPSGRKRRWSAPERDQTERAEEEPPPALPKPSFIPQEVKICIEGRSSIGI